VLRLLVPYYRGTATQEPVKVTAVLILMGGEKGLGWYEPIHFKDTRLRER
jgi:hypothetical protein